MHWQLSKETMDIEMASHVGTFDERIPEYRNAPLAVSVTDDGDDVTHTQLLGLGQDPAPKDWPVLLPSVQQAVRATPQCATGSSGLP